MTSTLDSKPFFASRARSIGLEDHVLRCLETAGVTTLAQLAFWCTYQPGSSDDSILVKAVADALGIDPVPAKTLIAPRRLHYEAHTVFVSDLRQKVVATEEDQPKRIPAAERAARYNEQKLRLPGLPLDGVHECSHALLDSVMQQYEHDECKWISLGSCTSRAQEQMGARKDAAFSLQSDGQLRIQPAKVTATADVSTDLKVKQAFTRRGLAYDQAGLIDFSTHSRWVEQMFKAMERAVPEHFGNITVQQCLDADKELWRLMADECRAGVVPSAGGAKPLDAALEKFRTHSDVLYFILPFSKRTAVASSSSTTLTLPDAEISNRKRKREENEKRKGDGKGKKGKKGGGKNIKGAGDTRMPDGCVNKTKTGQNICFRFNSPGGCTFNNRAGGSCSRGAHVCARPNCGEAHSAVACNKST